MERDRMAENLLRIFVKEKWWFDPNDINFDHPFLMKLSEKEEFGKMLPEHLHLRQDYFF